MRYGFSRAQSAPASGVGRKAGAGPNIPFNACTTPGQIHDGDMNPRGAGFKIRTLAEVIHPMLTLNCVIGLAAVDPAAIHTDAHALRTCG